MARQKESMKAIYYKLWINDRFILSSYCEEQTQDMNQSIRNERRVHDPIVLYENA